jgi:hypothetical protein
MKNSELLEKLQQLPPEMEVNLVIVLPYGAAFIHEFEIRESPKEILDDNESP